MSLPTINRSGTLRPVVWYVALCGYSAFVLVPLGAAIVASSRPPARLPGQDMDLNIKRHCMCIICSNIGTWDVGELQGRWDHRICELKLCIGTYNTVVVCTWIIHTILTYLKMLMAVRV